MPALQMNANLFKFVLAKICAPFFGKKVYITSPAKTIQLIDIAEPTLPGRDWVRLRTIYCGFLRKRP